MKNLFILIFSLFSISLFSQDQILLKSGEELEVKVIEINQDHIKYKKWLNQDGPLYSLTKSEIFKIKYQNGEEALFNTITSTPSMGENTQKTNRNNTPSLRPISSGINVNVLGFLQFGPIISYEAKIAENLFIVPHIRWSYLGLLEHVLWSDGYSYELDPASFAVGVGIKRFNLNEKNHAFYYGGHVSYSIGSADYFDTYEEQTAVQVTGNFGYRWRKDSGWHFNLGLLAGASIDIEDKEYFYDGRLYADYTGILPFGMLELTIGKEF